MTKQELFQRGIERISLFCAVNSLEIPPVSIVPRDDWTFDVCAYYRAPPIGIQICIEECQYPCGVEMSRNWSWPGSVTDREPFGVLAHELGHHADRSRGEIKYRYSSDYGVGMQSEIGEEPLTSYCPNPAEWFAEMFRLFVTNHSLLALVRPKTHARLLQDWTPVSGDDWLAELGCDVPERVVKALRNKMKSPQLKDTPTSKQAELFA